MSEPFRTELARQIAQAFPLRPSLPRRTWHTLTLARWRTRKLRVSLASLDTAEAEHRAREAAHLASLPDRMAAVSDEINSILRIAAQLAGGGACDNCGQPYAGHCGSCLIPCCPGKCAARGEVVTDYAGMLALAEAFDPRELQVTQERTQDRPSP